MANYFTACGNIEELNVKRQAILTEVNAEYNKRKSELLQSAPPYKRIPVLKFPAITGDSVQKHSAFQLQRVKQAINVLTVFDGGVMGIDG